jgi:hypothetical protein
MTLCKGGKMTKWTLYLGFSLIALTSMAQEELTGVRVVFDTEKSICPPKDWPAAKIKRGLADFDFPKVTKLPLAGMSVFKPFEKIATLDASVEKITKSYLSDKGKLLDKESMVLDGVKAICLRFEFDNSDHKNTQKAARVVVLLENSLTFWYIVPADQLTSYSPAIKASINSYKNSK